MPPSRRPAPVSRVRLLALALAVPLLGAGSCGPPIHLLLPAPSGVMPVEVALWSYLDPADVRLALDGADVTGSFTAGGPGLVGSIPVPAPGSHRLSVRWPLPFPMIGSLTTSLVFDAPTAAPEVLAIEPGPGAVPSGAWLRFRLAAAAEPSALTGFGFALECDGQRVARSAHALADGSLILNPTPSLPPGSTCRATWRAQGGGVAEALFPVAPAASGTAASVLYDRADPLALAPFPDDFWVEPDASQPSGRRVALPIPPFTDPGQLAAFTALAGLVGQADGWSRQTPIVIGLSHPLDASFVPADLPASQDPFAPIALVDVDPASPDYGGRVPYRLLVRSDPRPGGGLDNAAILFPAVDLRAQGRYALVFTRRAFAAGEPGRSFEPSALFAGALAGPHDGEPLAVTRVRAVVSDALDVVAGLADVPIPGEDVALALSISARTHPSVSDLAHVKEQALAGPPSPIVIPDVATDPCPTPGSFCIRLIPDRALEVRGRVRLPAYRDGSVQFVHDPATGEPIASGFAEAPFVMTLPFAALDGPVVPLMYQHGNPGSPTELLGANNEQLDDAGFALLGFQDTLNRELSPSGTSDERITAQVLAIFANLLVTRKMPQYWLQTGADQIHFLRAIQGLGTLDLIHRGPGGAPALGPDGQPEIDPSTILYKGISEGANNAQRFLPFAPEILAAEATVGGARLGETLIHQSADQILAQITVFLPQLTPLDLWVGLSLFQAGFDPQDGHTYLRHLYREPLLPFAGSADVTPPSTIWTEGIGDTLVPNNASRAMARELGIPHVGPVQATVPGLEQVAAPLAGNVAPGITAGYFQIDPAITPGPSCQDRVPLEGHYCPQSSAEARAQRLHFLLTALAGTAEIVDPFPSAE